MVVAASKKKHHTKVWCFSFAATYLSGISLTRYSPGRIRSLVSLRAERGGEYNGVYILLYLLGGEKYADAHWMVVAVINVCLFFYLTKKGASGIIIKNI